MRAAFTGVDVFDGRRVIKDATLVVVDGKVHKIVARAPAAIDETIGFQGGMLAPGFVDLQVNGGGGVLLNGQPDLDGIARIVSAHSGLGTIGLLPTLITSGPETLRATLDAGIAAAAAKLPGFLGLHLEGPHLDPKRPGAHDPALFRRMTKADVGMYLEAARRLPALMITLAPASVALSQIAALSEAGIIVSIGHSDTSAEDARAAFAAGATCVTHLFNAMSPLGHREPGLVGAALASENVRCGIIADGVHVAPEVLGIAARAKRGKDGLFVVTDAMSVAGTKDTGFDLDGRRVARRDGCLRLDDGTLAGADIDMAGSIRTLVQRAGIPLDTALAMTTWIPAETIGAGDRCGVLAPGRAAHFVHLDADLRLAGVWRNGERAT